MVRKRKTVRDTTLPCRLLLSITSNCYWQCQRNDEKCLVTYCLLFANTLTSFRISVLFIIKLCNEQHGVFFNANSRRNRAESFFSHYITVIIDISF